jgi:hypothetical protein
MGSCLRVLARKKTKVWVRITRTFIERGILGDHKGKRGENFNTSFRGVGETQGSLAISRVESLKKEILTGLLDMEISLEGAFF